MVSVGSARPRLTSRLVAGWRCYRQWVQERHALIEVVQRKDDHLLRDAGLSDADVCESLRVLPFLKSLISATDAAVKGHGSMASRIARSSTPSASIVWLHTRNIARKDGHCDVLSDNRQRVGAPATIPRSIQGPNGSS